MPKSIQLQAVVTLVFLTLFLMAGGAVSWRVFRQRRTLLSAPLTEPNSKLITSFIFYILTPLTYLVATGVRYIVVWAVGTRHPSMAQVVTITSVVPLTGFVMGLSLWLYAVVRPGRAARNHALREWGRQILAGVLWVLPTLSLIFHRGDMAWAQRVMNKNFASSGDVLLGLWLITAALLTLGYRRSRLKEKFRSITHPLYDDKRMLLDMLEHGQEPRADVSTYIELAKIALALDEPEEACQRLQLAIAREPNDAMTHFLMGVAYMKTDRPSEACDSLERAGYLASDPDRHFDESLVHEITLALSAAQLARGNAQRAIEVAQAAHEEHPRDPRAMFLHVDALVALGKVRDAKNKLEEAFARAEGQLAYEIRLKLESLSKRRERTA